MKEEFHKISLTSGDITKETTDAIVNAANSSLMGGGGVDGAIHRAGGPAILEECKKIIARKGSCRAGEAVITSGGNLAARFVIHTVGPVWNGGYDREAEKLSNCYKNSLKLASENNLHTIAFPNISTGIYGYPKVEAAEIAVNTVMNFLLSDAGIVVVRFVCFDKENYDLYEALINTNSEN